MGLLDPPGYTREQIDALLAALGHAPRGGLDPRDRGRALYHGVRTPRAALNLRFDDAYEQHYSTVLPLLVERGLVATFAIAYDYIDDPASWPGKIASWDDVREMQLHGMEIANHSRSHGDPTTEDDPHAYALAESVAVKPLFEARGIHQQTFAHPGTWAKSLSPDHQQSEWYLREESRMALPFWQRVAAAYVNVEGYIETGGISVIPRSDHDPDGPKPANDHAMFAIPHTFPYGRGHRTVQAAATNPLPRVLAWIDEVVELGATWRIMNHLMGGAGNLTVGDWEAILDRIAEHRDRGLLAVVTGAALPFVEQGEPVDLLGGALAEPKQLADGETFTRRLHAESLRSCVLTGRAHGGSLAVEVATGTPVEPEATGAFTETIALTGSPTAFHVPLGTAAGTTQVKIELRASGGAVTLSDVALLRR